MKFKLKYFRKKENTKMSDEFGVHVTIDASGCNKRRLTSQSIVYDILNRMPEKIGMTKMTLPYVVKWLDKFSITNNAGISGFVMLAESHISIHTFPDYDYVFIDIFSCRHFDTDKAVKYLTDAFDAKRFIKNILKRGLDFPQKVYMNQKPQVILKEM